MVKLVIVPIPVLVAQPLLIFRRLHDFGCGPGIHTGCADVAGDDADGNIHLLAQHTTYVVADGGEFLQILLGGHLPRGVVVVLHAVFIRKVTLGEMAHHGIADTRDVGGLFHTELHIGLTACQIDVAHQHVGEGDRFVTHGDDQLVGAACLHLGEIGHEFAVGLKLDGCTVQGGGAAAVALAEDGDGEIAL